MRFRESAAKAGASLETLPLSATGPAGENLSIDIARIGNPTPSRVFLHTTGIHGVEAFTGSAVQLALLDALPAPASDAAVILVHVLNPYGMAWLRRTNENNVDLNRNFIFDGGRWTGAPKLYAALDPLLNPPSPPSSDAFGVKALCVSLKHGFTHVKQAVAEGQYEYPRGLFFGGRELQDGPRLYADWLRERLSSASYVLALDLHTGLGKHGTDTVVPDLGATSVEVLGRVLKRHLSERVRESVAYTVRGGLGTAMPRVLPHARIDFLLQEIGTYPPLRVFHALREENRCHFYAGGALDQPAKSRLREALCPAAVDWRRRAVARGLELAQSAARFAIS